MFGTPAHADPLNLHRDEVNLTKRTFRHEAQVLLERREHNARARNGFGPSVPT